MAGAVRGDRFLQMGLRGYWPGPETFAWMQQQGMRWHFDFMGASRWFFTVSPEAASELRPTLPRKRSTSRRPASSRLRAQNAGRVHVSDRKPS